MKGLNKIAVTWSEPIYLKEEDFANENISNKENESLALDFSWLTLCYEVPFNYLVPEPSSLPSESIRFFSVDHNWINALVDGAASLGRNTEIDLLHDCCLLPNNINMMYNFAESIRPYLQKKIKNLELNESDNQATKNEWSGFLLRSSLVKGWRGLEFNGYFGNKEAMPALRLEELSKEVLIGIYPKEITCLEISEPPESFHLGFRKDNGVLKKTMRDLKTGSLEQREFRVMEKDNRVIDYVNTAANIRELIPERQITGAVMGFMLIQNPNMLVIQKK